MLRAKLRLLRRWPRAVCLSTGRSGSAAGPTRLSNPVAGAELWFESPDLSLVQSSEALGSAFLIPAAASGRPLVFESAPDAVWLDNAREVQKLAEAWWGYRRAALVTSGDATAQRPAGRGTTLCFTGGVDSFYTLLRGQQPITSLLFIHGYDMPPADTTRAQAAENSLRNVAAAFGQQAVVVRTNLRTHRLLRGTNWEHTHGGALAAVGHLLSDHADQLLISASYPQVYDRPWGSHWKLDPYWSSSRLTVTHVGAEKWRAEKLAAIMHESLVRQHLRVCWENRSPTGNCGQCEKCLRTMLVLEGHGCLGGFPVFPNTAALAENLGRLGSLKRDLIEVYSSFLELELSAKVRSALAALVRRSLRQEEPVPSR